MSYNWEEIFEKKSTKELFDIYKGKSFLSDRDASRYAKKELEKRNFDFNNIEEYNVVWEIDSLKKDESVYQTEFAFNKFQFISIKRYLIILVSFVLLLFLFEKYNAEIDFVLFLPYVVILISIFTLINNYIYKLQTKSQEKRLRKIKELENELENFKYNDAVFEEYQNSVRKNQKEEFRMRIIGIIITVISMIIIYFAIKRNLGHL